MTFSPTIVRRYGIAVVAAVAALLIWHTTMRGLRLGPFQVLIAAVVVASIYGGAGPGILAGALSVLGAIILYMHPEQRDVVQLLIFVLVSLGILAVTGERARLLRRERFARAAAEEEQRHALRLVAERDAAEADARAQRRRLYDLFMDAPARIALAAGPDLVYEFANHKYLELLGGRDPLGKPAREVFPEAEQQGIIATARRVYDTGEPFIATEQRFVVDYDEDGMPEERFYNVVLQPYRDPDGSIAGVMLFTFDVTQQVVARRQAERLVVQRDDFLAAAAHDLKTPLTTIKGLAQILLRRAAKGQVESGDALESLERIDATVTRMAALIEDLLNISRPEIAQRRDLERTPVDLVRLVRQIVGDQQERSDAHHIDFDTAAPEIIGAWDSIQLERAISNLLSNAVKYSPGGGTIQAKVSLDDEGEAVARVEVQDNGIGIPEADLPHIFRRFHRAENVVGVIPGTGIGLASARQIVESHGGTITAFSAEGSGARFVVRLPLGVPVGGARNTAAAGRVG